MSRKLIDQIASLYRNELNSDMKFVMDNEATEFPAHKFVIAFGSEELYRMVYGNGTTLATSTIFVPNCSSNDFLVFLKYLYTSEMEWSLDNCSSVLEVSRYFGVTELEDSFNKFLAQKINFDSALEVYQQYFHENNTPCRTAMKVIQFVLNKYLEKDPAKFFDLPAEAVTQILQMNELGIDENSLFLKMIRWANGKGFESISPVMENLLKSIRFVNMANIETTISSEIQEFINPRWEIKVINYKSIPKEEEDRREEQDSKDDNSTEIIVIQPRRTIRLHGLATFSLNTILAETNNRFEVIPCYRSQIFQQLGYDVMFENAITLTENTLTRLKVPASSVRYVYEPNDNFSIQFFKNGKEVHDCPIPAIFVSTSKL